MADCRIGVVIETPPARAIGLGVFFVSATYAVSDFHEQVTDTFQVVALNFQQLVFYRAASATGGFEFSQ